MIITLDFTKDIPIYVQIRNEIVTLIGMGKIKNGEKLPTVRALALEMGVNTMTVSKAYQLLKQEGYIVTDRRNGAIVRYEEKEKTHIMALVEEKMRVIIAEAKTGGIEEEELKELVGKLYNAR